MPQYRPIDMAQAYERFKSLHLHHEAGYLDAVYQDRQPLVVTRRNNEHVVMISIDEYHSLAETEYLLSEEANARHLRDSLRAARNGGAQPRELSED